MISQSPSADSSVIPGTAINLVISTGPCSVTVQNVVGMSQNNAQSVITDAGLIVGTVTQQCSDTVPVGKVISQSPSAGSSVTPGTVVNLVISNGPCKGCGCYLGYKSVQENIWWKYLVDFVLVGMVLFVMSGMQRRKEGK